jgi:DNA-binding NarL/FixJ family response regulator
MASNHGDGARAGAAKPVPPALTRRETEILALIGRGLSNPQIAEALLITEATVKKAINRLYRKLGIKDRTAAIQYAARHSL